MPQVERTKQFCRYRKLNPNKCDSRSFRVKKPNKDTLLTICCLKGEYNRKTKKCRTSTKLQSILKKHYGKRCHKFR